MSSVAACGHSDLLHVACVGLPEFHVVEELTGIVLSCPDEAAGVILLLHSLHSIKYDNGLSWEHTSLFVNIGAYQSVCRLDLISKQ